MDWYEAIFIRKSVRKYRDVRVSDEILAQIENCAQKIQCFDQTSSCCIRIYDEEDTKGWRNLFKVGAPHYMAIFAPKGNYGSFLAGEYSEQLVLYMTCKGIGTCYQGATKLPEKEIPEGMQLAMVIAFGYAKETLTRDQKDAKRQNLKNLVRYDGELTEELLSSLNSARLAPSAVNKQPWRFSSHDGQIDLYMTQDSIISKALVSGRIFDLGIALCHLITAVDHQWKHPEVKILTKEEAQKLPLSWTDKNCKYVATLYIR